MSKTVRVWAIGDPHLSFARPKPMDIFGAHWAGHADKLARNISKLVAEDDLMLIPGDISWAMKRSDAEPDLVFLSNLPGQKVLIKGNHDYWWDSDKPLSFPGLHDTPFRAYDDMIGVAGTRGWEDTQPGATDAEKATNRKHVTKELQRLEKRLLAVKDCKNIYAMIHYPPLPEFAPILREFDVKAVLYGHLHVGGTDKVLPEDWLGIRCMCVAADRIQFMPRLVATMELTDNS